MIRIVTSDIFSGDAIGNFTLQLKDFLIGSGFECQLYARYYDPVAGFGIRDFDLLFDEIKSGDILFAHFSIYEPGNDRYKELTNKKIVYYHGITPPEYFNNIDPQTAQNCFKGRQQYHCFKGFDYYMANSQFMLGEFINGVSEGDETVAARMRANSDVAPPTLNPLQWNAIDTKPLDLPLAARNFICVGRIAPHKKIEDVVAWFQAYTELDSNISLVVVGSEAPPAYGQMIREKVKALPEMIRSKIHFPGHVTPGQLKYLYQQSSGLITLSEHEGFCVPLLEAMYFELPVIARKAAAIPATLGRDEGLLEGQSLAKFARESREWLTADDQRDAILEKQSRTLQALLRECDGKRILKALRTLER